ncbi:hypothetical protein WCLP8_5450002 [uncultured Gammaproteobacteria bacterium]
MLTLMRLRWLVGECSITGGVGLVPRWVRQIAQWIIADRLQPPFPAGGVGLSQQVVAGRGRDRSTVGAQHRRARGQPPRAVVIADAVIQHPRPAINNFNQIGRTLAVLKVRAARHRRPGLLQPPARTNRQELLQGASRDPAKIAQKLGEEAVEAIGYNPLGDLPVDRIGVRFTDGIAVDYTVLVTDRDGGFTVWARNLDRALELQAKTGDYREFNLRDYQIDLDHLDEAGSSDDSAYRVEILTPAQFHFATSLGGIDFHAEMLTATADDLTGHLGYSVTAGGGANASARRMASRVWGRPRRDRRQMRKRSVLAGKRERSCKEVH